MLALVLGAWSALAILMALLIGGSIRHADVEAGLTGADGVVLPPG